MPSAFSSSSRRTRVLLFGIILGSGAFGASLVLVGCGSDSQATPSPTVSLGDSGGGGFVDVRDPDASKTKVDGGFESPDGGVIRADRFITTVVSFTPGPCAGFGGTEMPDIIEGPPVGAGDLKGGLDVVSLGVGGELVVSFAPNAIIDKPGVDFIVFENAFYGGGDKSNPSADPAEISVSEDGVTWKTFECAPPVTTPYGKCAGWHPVYSAPGNGISPVDPLAAGGDAYDLSELGLASASFVRIKDKSTATCDGAPGQRPTNSGFDLDAIAIVNAKDP